MKSNRAADEVRTLYNNKNIDGLYAYAKNNPKHKSKAIAYARRLQRKELKRAEKLKQEDPLA